MQGYLYFILTISSMNLFSFRLWMCTFTLAVSGGAVLLLPMSIFANEILIHYPKSYLLQWIHSSLIQGRLNGSARISILCSFVQQQGHTQLRINLFQTAIIMTTLIQSYFITHFSPTNI